ncbi:hypothetical protein HN709_02740, partial [Candidatus Peregrinibacteria bacterium]|nr:hypothetical protein [Candidatus Peregrinibacteria bacterium]
MFKKLLSIVATTALLATILPMTAFAGFATFITDITPDLTETDGDNQFEPENGEIAIFSLAFDLALSSDVTVNAAIFDDAGLVKEYAPVVGVASNPLDYEWNGKDSDASYCGDASTSCPAGTYSLVVFAVNAAGDIQNIVQPFDVTSSVGPSSTITLSVDDTSLDFAEDGDNEELRVSYTVEGDFNDLTFYVKDFNDDIVEIYSPNTPAASESNFPIWDGDNNFDDLSDPGKYSVYLAVTTDAGPVNSDTVTFDVFYGSKYAPFIEEEDADVDPSDFDPDDEEAEITFSCEIDEDDDDDYDEADVWVEIQEVDGTTVRTFSDYNGDSVNIGDTVRVKWDGERNSNSQMPNGDYKVYLRCENAAGVGVQYLDVTISDDGGSDLPSSNSHIGGIDFDPSSTYEPTEDGDLEIEYDIKKDLDELKVYAVRGSEEIELYDEDDEDEIDKKNNYTLTWDGTDDDDEYVEAGTWRIRFESKIGATVLEAEESIKLKFDEPSIDDFELMKDSIDTEAGESTYIIFRTDEDADVDIFVYEDGEEEDEIEEDFEVEGDKWYAIEWDGDSYDNDDDDKDIEIKLVAKTVGGSESDSEKIDLEFEEDDVSSSKSNITNDYISPAVADSGDSMSIFYELEDDAEVTITIHKGTSSSGSKMIELIDDVDQDSGDYEIEWDGKDDDGDKLKDGFYTYKIVSKDKSTETETGIFAIGDVGDEDSSSSSSSNNGNVNSNVKIVSGDGSTVTTSGGDCGGYTDVSDYSENCDAIAWATSAGVFQGYSDGTFKPYQAINRAEVLKVLLEGLGLNILPTDNTSLGFSDVDASAWYMPYIKTAKTFGIFQGDGGASTARP